MGITSGVEPRTGTASEVERLSETSAEVERRIFKKIGWRLLPLLIASYILNYLDRTNISFAALTMNEAVGLNAAQFGVGAGIFFLGYCFLELPSNMVLYRVGARRWIARIMISWGLVSAGTAFVTGPTSFYVLRFLLGAAEAGFFPGIAFYLATWFPAEYRTRVIAWFMLAIPVAWVVGGPVSGLLLGLDGVGGLAGWQWLFIVEGSPVVLLGIVVLIVLADRPEQATWLTPEERRIVRHRLDSERRLGEVRHLLPALKDRRVWMLAGVQFGFLVGSYGTGIWLPQIVRAGNLSNMEIGFVTSGCWAVASVGMILWAGHVDRRGGKVGNLSLACLLAAGGFVFSILSTTFWASIAGLTVSLVGINAARGIFWTIPPRFLSGMAAAGGLAFINSIGTMGGFVGPSMVGWLTQQTGNYQAGLIAMTGFLAAASLLAWSLKLVVKQD